MVILAVSKTFSLPAFPGAEGWGADATGGRGGAVIHVTTLNSYGAGSLRAACNTAGPKIIVFDVSGVINCGNDPISVNSNTTVAGQSSPGGITLQNGAFYGNSATNIIIRHIRVRRSPDVPDGDCLRFISCTKIVLDHCSAAWNSDETIDICLSSLISITNCILAEPGYCWYSYGGGPGDALGNNRTAVLGGPSEQVTLYRTLISQSRTRNPDLTNLGNTSPVGKTFELINNAFYNYFGGNESFASNNTIPLNLIGNWYGRGPATAHQGQTPATMYVYSDANYHYPSETSLAKTAQKVYFNANTCKGFADSAFKPLKTSVITTAKEAFAAITAGAGALPHDSLDLKVIQNLQNGTGEWIDFCDVPDSLAPVLITSGPARPLDTDNDGMADSWETTHSLNPNDATDRTTDMGGYNAVEVYLNDLADSILIAVAVEQPGAVAQGKNHAVPSVAAAPNPFNPEVRFTLANMPSSPVWIYIINMEGKLLHSALLPAGFAAASWNGRDATGRPAASGIYAARFISGNTRLEKRVSLVR